MAKEKKLNKIQMRKVLSDIFKSAHEQAKRMKIGPYKVRLSISLVQAWKEFKEGLKDLGKNLVKLIGSPKQVQWAQTIREVAIDTLEEAWIKVQGKDLPKSTLARHKETFEKMMESLVREQYAETFIERLRFITYKETYRDRVNELRKWFKFGFPTRFLNSATQFVD